MKIRLEHVSAGYEKNKDVLKDISLTLTDGGVWGILGPNGAGKTTLLRVLAGTLPYRGRITLDAEPETELSQIKRRTLSQYISLLPQFSSVYFSYTVYDTVLLGRYARQGNSLKERLGGPGKEDCEAVNQALERTGIRELSGTLLSRLSGGQLQRVLLARTMAQETPVILLDEPTNHLDLKYRQALLTDLAEWAKETTAVTTDGNRREIPNTVISVFHDIGAASLIADRILLIHADEEGNPALQSAADLTASASADQRNTRIETGPAKEMLSRDRLMQIYDTDVIGWYEEIHKKLDRA